MNLQFLQKLSEAHAVSGQEEEVLHTVQQYIQDSGSSIKTGVDHMLNLYLQYPEQKKSCTTTPRIMLDAHSDEVGLMVQSINDQGLISFVPLGGWAPTSLPAQAMQIKNRNGEYVTGIVVSKPPHFLSEAEKNAAPTIENLQIDVGASSRDEVIHSFNIDIGNPIAPLSSFHYNSKNGLIRGKAFDNRVGCFCLVELMKELENTSLPIELIGAIASQEEVGLRGARITAQTIKPDFAIVFEGSPADDIFTPASQAQGILGKGVQIRYRDSSFLANQRITNAACSIADKAGIPYQRTVRTGGGTNAGVIHLTENGIPVLVLGVPVRYIHTHHGFMKKDDISSAIAFAKLLIEHYPKLIQAAQF